MCGARSVHGHGTIRAPGSSHGVHPSRLASVPSSRRPNRDICFRMHSPRRRWYRQLRRWPSYFEGWRRHRGNADRRRRRWQRWRGNRWRERRDGRRRHRRRWHWRRWHRRRQRWRRWDGRGRSRWRRSGWCGCQRRYVWGSRRDGQRRCWGRRRAAAHGRKWWLRLLLSRGGVPEQCHHGAGRRRDWGRRFERRRPRFHRGSGRRGDLPMSSVRLQLLLWVEQGPASGRRLCGVRQRTRVSSEDGSGSYRQPQQLRLLPVLPIQRQTGCRARTGWQSHHGLLFRPDLGSAELRGLRQDLQRRCVVREQHVHPRLLVVHRPQRRLRQLRCLLRQGGQDLRGRLRPVGQGVPSLVGPGLRQLWRQHLLVVRHVLPESVGLHRCPLLLRGMTLVHS